MGTKKKTSTIYKVAKDINYANYPKFNYNRDALIKIA